MRKSHAALIQLPGGGGEARRDDRGGQRRWAGYHISGQTPCDALNNARGFIPAQGGLGEGHIFLHRAAIYRRPAFMMGGGHIAQRCFVPPPRSVPENVVDSCTVFYYILSVSFSAIHFPSEEIFRDSSDFYPCLMPSDVRLRRPRGVPSHGPDRGGGG